MKIGVEGFTFDSAHYTQGITDKCTNIHGHTFTLDVEIKGKKIDEETGMLVDFGVLKNTVKKVLEDWDHKFIVPKSKTNEIKIKGPFSLDLKTIPENAATTENIAKEIAKQIHNKIELPVKVKIYEGEKSYATCKWPE